MSDPALVRNLNSLLEVAKVLGAEVRLDSLLDLILAKAADVMEADRSSLFLHDESTGSLVIRGGQDVAQGEVRVPLGVGIAGHVAETRALLNVPDAYADPRFDSQADRSTRFRTRSILCAPMLTSAGKLIGVTQVLNKRDGAPFTSSDEQLLLAFASLAGIAVDRARLVEAFIEKQKLESSLRLAHDIQMSMLPTALPERPELQLFATLRPAKSVGGDLYTFQVKEPYLWFLIGDVSGKGVPAALFMAMTKVLFDASMGSEAVPADVAARVNRELCRNNEQGLYVTAFLGRLDLSSGELLYTNAGHNPTYHLQSDGSVSALAREPGLVLGVMEFDYQSETLRLAPGDGLFLYTDGVTEAQNPAGEEFEPRRLEEYLRRANGVSAQELVLGTLQALEPFVAGAPQFDDTTVLCLRYLGR